jgi:acyl-CoA thioester hydrolase
MPEIYEHHHTVRQDEIDGQGHANNVVYVRWMQDAAVAHSAAQGWPGERYALAGFGWVVRWHRIEYLQPALAGDQLLICTWVATMQKVMSLRRYRFVRAGDQALLGTAETMWAFIDYATARPARILPAVAAAFTVVDDPADSPLVVPKGL